MSSEIISYVYGAMAAGAIGNSTYDSIKYILGKTYVKLNEYIEHNDKKSFEVALEAVLSSNKEIKKHLESLVNNPSLKIKMEHSGDGDNVARDKTENHYYRYTEAEKKF